MLGLLLTSLLSAILNVIIVMLLQHYLTVTLALILLTRDVLLALLALFADGWTMFSLVKYFGIILFFTGVGLHSYHFEKPTHTSPSPSLLPVA